MKPTNFLFLTFAFLLSCAPTKFFQLCTTKAEGGTVIKDELVFEDANCKALYNLWGDGGSMELYVFNKTDEDLIIDLKKTFFVFNNLSQAYYPDLLLFKDPSASYIDRSEITIPPNSMIKMPEFKILANRLVLCEISNHPKEKEGQVLKFELLTSPIVFYNLISYNIGNETIRFENHFYVNEINNMPYSSSSKYVYTDECGRKLDVGRRVYKAYSPDKFYFEYTY
ncbi:MAG: hypothetical protein IPL92_07820 [Saprospiraceae bacterium]|nr:hypothetical protein [Candidatus Opimibacter iunctus]